MKESITYHDLSDFHITEDILDHIGNNVTWGDAALTLITVTHAINLVSTLDDEDSIILIEELAELPKNCYINLE